MVMHTNAEHGNIIIIGRGGSFILKDKAFRVRIIAPLEIRMERVMRDRQMSQKEALEYVKKYDGRSDCFLSGSILMKILTIRSITI